MELKKNYDLIVCGGGHAGCEAANTASKFKLNVLLITGNLDTLSQMNCNPSVGGQAKGHIVCEIDSLGGLMGNQADSSGIHFKLLNSSKGEAVQSPRVQCDKVAYSLGIKKTLDSNQNIHLLQASVEEILTTVEFKIKGVRLNLGFNIYCKALIITTGTYLNGNVLVGKNKHNTRYNRFGGGLKGSLKSFGVETRVFKTGTPPRILGSTINFNKCYRQPSDLIPTYFSKYLKNVNSRKTRDCWITNTNATTHSLVYENIYNSGSYSKNNYIGPRYCPSIEDKIIKFRLNPKHKVFLEPEGLHTGEWYVSGVSSSLSLKMQYKVIKSIKGLEKASIVRPGYSIQYDYIPSTNILQSLECKNVKGLFLAGQVNGTTGYEEAASQGLVAGLNASLRVTNSEPEIFNNRWSYIGVLVNDISEKKILEPYRVFTYRADNRLILNYESACFRMLNISKKYKLLDKKIIGALTLKSRLIQNWTSFFIRNKGYTTDNVKFMGLSKFIRRNVIYRLKYSSYLKNNISLNNPAKQQIQLSVRSSTRKELVDSWILKK